MLVRNGSLGIAMRCIRLRVSIFRVRPIWRPCQRRWLIASTSLSASFADYFDFKAHENDSFFMNLLEEILPGWYAGPGTPFHISGDFTYNFDTYAWQYE